MSVLDQRPANKNPLSPTGLVFAVEKLPAVNFTTQRANLPGFSIPVIERLTMLQNQPLAGDKFSYDELVVQFIVDEDMENYREIFAWCKALGEPETTDQYLNLENLSRWRDEGIVSDGSMIIYDSKRNPNIEIRYVDMFPRAMSGLILDVTADNIQFLTCNVTFAFLNMDIRLIKPGSNGVYI